MIVELRQYLLKPGRRDELIALFDREFVEPQEQLGMRVLGRFRDLDRPDVFVWLRGFADMDARRSSLEAFYSGPVWKEHGPAANATMIDSDDVLLLNGPPFDAITSPVDVTVFYADHPWPPSASAGTLTTEYATNDFPALPVREGEHALVVLGSTRPPFDGTVRTDHLRLEPTVASGRR